MTEDTFTPRPEHKFTFGLWTVGNRGREPFGDAVRDTLKPVDAVQLLAEVGAFGINFHDNDLVPIDATPTERNSIVSEFRKACETQSFGHHVVAHEHFRPSPLDLQERFRG